MSAAAEGRHEVRVAARLPAADAQVLPAEGSFKEAA